MEDKWGGYLKKRSLLGPSTSYRYLPSNLKQLNQDEINENSLQHQIIKGSDPCLGGSQVALVIKNPPAYAGDMRGRFDPWVRKIH